MLRLFVDYSLFPKVDDENVLTLPFKKLILSFSFVSSHSLSFTAASIRLTPTLPCISFRQTNFFSVESVNQHECF